MPLDQTEAEVRAQIRAIADRLEPLEGPMLPILHAVQASFGHVPQVALSEIADVLNLTAAEVHGIVSFYHDFRTEPAGRCIVRLCRAEACKSMGMDRLAAEVTAATGLGWGETTADGAVTLEAVYCLGLCACAPAAMVGDRLVGRATVARVLEEMTAQGVA